jgi:tryptophan halogenase
MNREKFSIGIIGSGTAGLISALMLRRAFPRAEITILSSSKIGIVGVGEGSTEHWKQFMQVCDIPLADLLSKTAATHKYGIRFEGWSNAFPDYFHSVTGDENVFAWGHYATYMGILESGRSITSQTSSAGLIQDKVQRHNLHNNVNQFHFDTFKLNAFFIELCFSRAIKMVDGEVEDCLVEPEHGTITEVKTTDGLTLQADFWVDASGFSRTLISKISDANWVSFSEYLLCDSAIAFPTASDPSGKIKSYTRARAASAGWIWEIPTQERRGNGYVYSSGFISDEKAISEAADMVGVEPTSPRVFKFDPGYLEQQWVKNCVAVGLASGFVEPLEATSIGSTIQQIKLLIPYLATYDKVHTASQKHYNKTISIMMDNILSMIRLHYYTDKTNSEFWVASKNAKVNDSLAEMLELWQERPPTRNDYSHIHGEMFLGPHMFHVAQGQGVLNEAVASRAIDRLDIRVMVSKDMSEFRLGRYNHELVDHAEALNEIRQ